jgi:hypothetical protein
MICEGRPMQISTASLLAAQQVKTQTQRPAQPAAASAAKSAGFEALNFAPAATAKPAAQPAQTSAPAAFVRPGSQIDIKI